MGPFLVQRAVEDMLGGNSVVFNNEVLVARAMQYGLTDTKKDKKEGKKEEKKVGEKEEETKEEEQEEEEEEEKKEEKEEKEGVLTNGPKEGEKVESKPSNNIAASFAAQVRCHCDCF